MGIRLTAMFANRPLLTGLLLTATNAAFAEPYRCPENFENKLATVSIAFDYGKTLNSTQADGAFFDERFGTRMGRQPVSLRDKDATGTKQDFLRSLAQKVGDKEFVQLGYSGHGLIRPDGRWAMLLPSVPKNLEEKCGEEINDGLRGAGSRKTYSAPCSALNDYMITADDLRAALPGKKIFAVLDSCLSGGVDFGKDGLALVAAMRDQTATGYEGERAATSLVAKPRRLEPQEMGLSTFGGAFSSFLKNRFSLCEGDTNKDGHLDASELVGQFGTYLPGTTAAKARAPKKAGKIHSTMNQRTGVIATSNQPWLSCLSLGALDGTCDGSRRVGDVARTHLAETILTSASGSPLCTLKPKADVQILGYDETKGAYRIEAPSGAGCRSNVGYVKKDQLLFHGAYLPQQESAGATHDGER